MLQSSNYSTKKGSKNPKKWLSRVILKSKTSAGNAEVLTSHRLL